MIALLVIAAWADVATPAIPGLAIYPWDETAREGVVDGPIAVRRVDATIDLYPTRVRVDAKYLLRGPPGAYTLGIPTDTVRSGGLLPFRGLDLRVGGAVAVLETSRSGVCRGGQRVAEGADCPGEGALDALLRRSDDWGAVRVVVPEAGEVEVTAAFEQLGDGMWHRYGGGYVGLGWAPSSPAGPVELAVVARHHGTSAAFRAADPTETRPDLEAWHLAEATVPQVWLAQKVVLETVPRAQELAPYADDPVFRLEDWLQRFVYDPAPHDPEAWIVLIEALHAASDDPEVGREATLALQDLQAWLATCPPGEAHAEALAWLEPSQRVEGAGVLAEPAVRGWWAEDASAALEEAVQIRAERAFWRWTVGAGSVVVGGLALVFAARRRSG